MKLPVFSALFLTAHLVGSAAVTPVSKVLQLLSSLESKIAKDGDVEEKLFEKYMDWCKNAKADTGYEIKTAKAQIEDLTSTIGKAISDIDASSTKIEELAGSISQDTADLKSATEIRAKESAEFTATEEELVEAVDMLDRAINILEKKLRGSAALVQSTYNTKDMKSIMSALNAVVDAASLSLHDKNKLLSLAQSQNNADDGDDDVGAPAPEAYKSHSGNIIDVLEDMREKAQGQLAEIRKEEASAKHNFQMLKQSLEDQITYDTKELEQSKTNKAAAAETKAVAEGDLAVTKKDLADDEETLENMDSDCASKKEDHESSVKSRAEELQALAKAKEIIAGSTGGASSVVYSEPSFLQVDGADQRVRSQLSSHADLVNLEVVNLVRQLAKKENSATLMQLAGRIQAAFRYSKNGGSEDPFAKVKAMISEMLTKLEADAKSEASHKEYCDKEFGATKSKMEELKATIDKLSAKKDSDSAASTKLKGEVQELQSELATIAKAQAEADQLRGEEHKAFVSMKADLEQGLEGVRGALQILREYYANDEASLVQQPEAPGTHSKNEGAGESIISMLEVIEGDFGKSLAGAEVEEDAAAAAYQKTSMMNKITKAQKEKDVEYKTKEAASLDKALVEASSDLESAQSELDAILEYNKGLISQCVAKPETYEERKGRREAELAGLKQALKILEGQAVLIQQSGLRGASVAPHRQ
mmetsp:Transcript_60496/g.94116  ORF Transcript_60496/g.94116 Transcript_60496/m.94116 type:complete len:705 (-) Transcript_60496:59-2173(-)